MAVSTSSAAPSGAVRVMSFGYGHGPAPTADVTVDVREWFRDPRVSPVMRGLTGLDPRVRAHVLATPGVVGFIAAVTATVVTLGRLGRGVTVAVGCVGGRHRSVVIADAVAAASTAAGVPGVAVHLHLTRPVLPCRRQQ